MRPKPLRDPSAQVSRIKRWFQKNPKKWQRYLERIKEKELRDTWGSTRGYNHFYNPFFGSGLAKFFNKGLQLSIEDALLMIQRAKGQPLRIVEDGPGKGIFLSQLKAILAKKGVKTITTGLAFRNNPELKDALKAGRIDCVENGPAELFVPKKPVDAIFSLCGSLYYVEQEVGVRHLLKFAYCLKKGGLLMVGGINLSEKKISLVKKTLERTGFKVGIYERPSEFPQYPYMPPDILIAQRMNIFSNKKFHGKK